MKKIAISGYFDPIHVGHIEYINNAKKLGDWLIVIVNTFTQLEDLLLNKAIKDTGKLINKR